jgi:hypothetical protein
MEIQIITTYVEEMKHKCGKYIYICKIEAIYCVSVFITFVCINSINYGNVISLINIDKKL